MGMVDPREMESKMASLNFPRHFYWLCVEVISLFKNLKADLDPLNFHTPLSMSSRA